MTDWQLCQLIRKMSQIMCIYIGVGAQIQASQSTSPLAYKPRLMCQQMPKQDRMFSGFGLQDWRTQQGILVHHNFWLGKYR